MLHEDKAWRPITKASSAVPREAKRPLIHAVGGLVALLVLQVLGVYKPRDITPYGRREQREQW